MKKAITQETVDQVIQRRTAGVPASKLPEELGLPSSTVNVILSAAGMTKAREEIRERDVKRLATWLENGAEDRPAAPIAADEDEATVEQMDAETSVKALKAAAKDAGIKGYSRMNRAKLLEVLDAHALAV